MKRIFLLATIISLSCFASLLSEVFVLYTPHVFGKFGKDNLLRSRLGNQLLTLMRAYSVAKSNSYTLIYEPIQINLFDELNKKIKTLSCEDFLQYKKFKSFKGIKNPNPNHNYILKLNGLALGGKIAPYATSDVVADFREMLFAAAKNFIPPQENNNSINIAVHVRTGIGFDSPLASVQYYSLSDVLKERRTSGVSKLKGSTEQTKFLDVCKPTKAPPMQFYINAMEYLVSSPDLVNKDINFFIYTDHPNPSSLIKDLKKHASIPLKLILAETLHHLEDTEFEDLLLMSSMSGLIRPAASTFSLLASLISKYKYEVFPDTTHWRGKYLVVEKAIFKTPGATQSVSFWKNKFHVGAR